MNSTAHASKPRGRIPAVEIAQHEEALLLASSILFREHGFASVSIDMIARAARVSPKTIYARFGGKKGLFAAVIERMVEQPLAIMATLKEAPQGDPASALRKVATAFLDNILDTEALALHRMVIAEATRMPELSALFYEQGPAKVLELLTSWLDLQNAAGSLRIPDPKTAAQIFIGLIEGEIVHRALLLGTTPSSKERSALLDISVSIFVGAYGMPKRKGA
jgi:TetR/AcrR family transcriptional repressor of mexJK operon